MDAYCNPRFQMWCRLIPGYADMTDTGKTNAKNAFTGKGCWSCQEPEKEDYIKTAAIEYAANPINELSISILEEKMEEEVMNTYSETDRQRDHLLGRLYAVEGNKDWDARKAFNLDDDNEPRTGKELLERIKAGKFTFDEDFEKKSLEKNCWGCYGPMSFIKWRDPAKVADKDGYKAWMEKTRKAYQTAQDEIKIKDPKDGLEVLRAFESATIN